MVVSDRIGRVMGWVFAGIVLLAALIVGLAAV